MDPTFITAAGTFIVAVGGATGGAVAFFIKRADKRREENEARLLAHLTKELAYWKEVAAIRQKDATAWREQLIANDITPTPADWTPLPTEEP